MRATFLVRLAGLLLAVLVLPASAQPAPGGLTFHVAPSGDDAGPGTAARPFATLEAARDALRRARGGEKTAATIWLHGGVYRRTEPFVLDARDAGTDGAPVVYRAVPGETVRLTGGRTLDPSAFAPVRDAAVLQRLAPEARAYVVHTSLPAQGVIKYGEMRQYGHGLPVVPAPLELFFADRPMQLARYPNLGEIPMGTVLDPGSVPRVGDETNRGGTFVYADPRHARWAGEEDAWLQGTFMWGYADDLIRIAAIDTVRRTVHLAAPHLYGLGSGEAFRQYVALNLLGELDEPGEYYLDRATGTLYFWPPGPLDGARIAVSELERPLVFLDGTSHVVLRGLTFEVTRGVGLAVERGEGNLIDGCTVRNTGTLGILMGQGSQPVPGYGSVSEGKPYRGTPVSGEVGDLQNHLYRDTAWNRQAGTGHGVRASEVYYTGAGGIFLGGGDKRTLAPGGAFVEDSRIHDYNRRNKFLFAGISVDGVGNRVAHNEIYNSGYQGIFVRGNEHVFEYNLLHDISYNSADTSPWYIGRDPSDRGNVVRYNFFHHIGRPDRMVMGVYLDDGTCGTEVYGNVFYKTASYGTVYSNAGHDNTVRHNLFIESYGPAVHLKSMWYDFAKDLVGLYYGPGGIYRQRLTEAVDIYSPPYSTRYPELRDFLDLMPDGETFVGMRPRRNVMEGNVIYRCPEALRLTAPHAAFETRGNFVTDDDPGFVDAARMDFRLRDDASVFDHIPDFPRIPFEKIGPRGSAKDEGQSSKE